MAFFEYYLTLFDIMAEFGYIRTEELISNPQVLNLRIADRIYSFQLETFHLNERRKGPVSSAGHSHNVYHLVLYTEGENEFIYTGNSTISKPGTFILSSPGEPHDFGPRKPGITSYHEVTFSLKAEQDELTIPFDKLLNHYSGLNLSHTPPIQHLSTRQLNWAELYYQRLHEHLKDYKNFDWFFIHRIILDLFSFIIQELYLPELKTIEEKPDILSTLKDKIDKQYAQDFSIKKLANQANMSQEHFSRIFKAKFGLAPNAYRQSVRIKTAMNLLKTTNLQCQEIAERTGFSSLYAFSRAFSKEAGISASNYRQNN